MSLVGLLPPLSDNGNLLVDGGYRKYNNFRYGTDADDSLVDNLPVREAP